MTLKEQRAEFFPVGTQPRRQQQQEEALMPPLSEKHPHAGAASSAMPISRSASASARPSLPPPPQAASRHRVGHTAGAHPEDHPFTDEEDEEEELYPKRPPSNVIRRRASVTMTTTQHPAGPLVRRRSAVQTDQVTSPAPSLSPRGQHRRLLLGMGIGMCSFGMLFVAGEHALAWWEQVQDDWRYGNPRTFQIDAVVGHDDSADQPSHFIAENLHGQVLIIEFPGGDPSKARVFTGPLLGKGADLTPVTLAFQDVNGDGTLDMVVTVGALRFVLINEKGTFRPVKSGEQINL